MNGVPQTRKNTLASKLRHLDKALDAKAVDEVFDEILEHITELGSVACTLEDDSILCLQSSRDLVAKVKSPHAKAILRLMCARLAVRCSEWTKRKVSPYGDHIEFDLPGKKQPCQVEFENTPDVQRFEIMEKPVPRSSPTPS